MKILLGSHRMFTLLILTIATCLANTLLLVNMYGAVLEESKHLFEEISNYNLQSVGGKNTTEFWAL